MVRKETFRHHTSLQPIIVISLICLFYCSTIVLMPSLLNADNRAAIIARSVISASTNDNSRLIHAMAKARRGEPFVVGVFGGSITAGVAARKVDNRWSNIVTKWWRQRFPKSKITLVNAGLGGTGSAIGAFRAESQLLRKKPDFVVIEFTINDIQPGLPPVDQTMEGVIRQTFKSANKPAVMLLFTMNKKGRNVQAKHIPCGKHYGIPMIGYRDALYPEMKSGRIPAPDIFADHVHPNNKGHKWCADLITAYLDKVFSTLPDDSKLPSIPAIPPPLRTDTYENASIYFPKTNIKAIQKPTSCPINKGWKAMTKKGRLGGGHWFSKTPGSILELEFDKCTSISIIYMKRTKGMGSIEFSVDGGRYTKRLDGANSWGSLYLDELSGLEGNKRHKVKIKLLDQTNDAQGGHRFEIHGIGIAGVQK